jgi:hypothetical protein
MKTLRKLATGLAVAMVGLFFWNGAPDFRPIFAWTLIAAIGCYLLLLVAQRMIRRLLSNELVDLRHKMDAATDKLEILDRKLTVLLKDALEQRQQR